MWNCWDYWQFHSHITEYSKTLINLFFTSCPDLNVSGVIPVGFSDHSAIFAVRKLHRLKVSPPRVILIPGISSTSIMTENLKNGSPDQKSRCRTCTQACNSPFNYVVMHLMGRSTDAFFFAWKYHNKKKATAFLSFMSEILTCNLKPAIHCISLYVREKQWICAILQYILIPGVFHPLGWGDERPCLQ